MEFIKRPKHDFIYCVWIRWNGDNKKLPFPNDSASKYVDSDHSEIIIFFAIIFEYLMMEFLEVIVSLISFRSVFYL